MRGRFLFRNILGAFSDGAVLFPLLALLTARAGFSGFTVLLSTGLAYVAAAAIFRVPMAVQPLKSIAVSAVAVGATFDEIRLSGALLGGFCLAVLIFDVERWARRVPVAVVHQLQVGLGVLLGLQGISVMGGWAAVAESAAGVAVIGGAALMVLWPEIGGVPLLGLVATAGVLIAVLSPGAALDAVASSPGEYLPMRAGIVAGLLLPQVVLTWANSVLATRDVCERYFGKRAKNVSIRSLLCSIGFGNVLVAGCGGMPFCHGSGGVTAHVRGGSTQAWSTGITGVFLLSLAGLQFVRPSAVWNYPPMLMAALLIATGIFHLKLAAPTFKAKFGWLKISMAFVLTIWTRNLLWALSAAAALELVLAVPTVPQEAKS